MHIYIYTYIYMYIYIHMYININIYIFNYVYIKENDMEAYAKLVQETKNDRLHFLLNQTDTYLDTINKMVQNQRYMDLHVYKYVSIFIHIYNIYIYI
jgi:hypothetical protein